MRRLSIVLAVFALTFAVMPAATAQRSMLHAELGGAGGPDFDPAAVAERCPEGFGWVYNTMGEGMLETPEYTGPYTSVGQHCSRWHFEAPIDPDKWCLGRVGDGMMTMTTPDGDLVIRYKGKFRFQGDVSVEPPEFVSLIKLFYKIDGELSTGVFAGAYGVGLMVMTDKFEAGMPSFEGVMRGPIHFDH